MLSLRHLSWWRHIEPKRPRPAPRESILMISVAPCPHMAQTQCSKSRFMQTERNNFSYLRRFTNPRPLIQRKEARSSWDRVPLLALGESAVLAGRRRNSRPGQQLPYRAHRSGVWAPDRHLTSIAAERVWMPDYPLSNIVGDRTPPRQQWREEPGSRSGEVSPFRRVPPWGIRARLRHLAANSSQMSCAPL